MRWWKPRKSSPSAPFGELRDPGLLGIQPQPEHVQDRRHQLTGLLGLLAGGAENDEVICILR